MKIARHGLPVVQKIVPIVLGLLVVTTALSASKSPPTLSLLRVSGDIHKIKHIVVIMEENRSFDSYFGTFPGADGISMVNGIPTVCVPDPLTDLCVRPFHDSQNLNHGGPHGAVDAKNDINNGQMNGFIKQMRSASKKTC